MAAEEALQRGRNDSKNSQGDIWQPSSTSTLSISAQMTSSGGSERLDTEVPSPPLAVISSRVKSASALENCANFETATVRYAYETTTLSRLLKSVGERLRGRKALSVALVVHGSPGCFKLCSQKTVTSTTLREDEELRKFFETLVSTYLNSHSQYARIDILNCPVSQNSEGEKLIADMKKLLGVPVFAYSDIQGAQITEAGSDEKASFSRIGTLYFDGDKLKDWSAASQQTMALFERIRTVGKGAYGAAVLYRKKDDGSHVILKEINLMDLTKTERNSAMNEAQILSRLDHPNIISYYDNFEEDGVLMIEMEYADGGTLAQFLQKQIAQNKPLPEKDVLTMFSQMVDALKYLHDHNILHRDLKTANVFLTKEGIVKLGDFGISKILSATSPEANTVLGTPYYISPEICEGKGYDAKSDIWSLGCILYEMVCLQKTFEGTNLPVLVHKIVEVSFTPVRGDYSDGLKQLISEMLQKEPEERPSAKEIFTSSLPLLTSQFASSDDEEEDEQSEDAAKTHTKSFLFYLDGVSLLLYHVPATFQTRVDHISVGYGHTLALADEGMVFSWGVGSRGQLGHGDKETRRSPQLIEAIKGKRIIRVECGGEFSVLVTDNGILMTCGSGDQGAQGHHDNHDCLKPKLVEDLITHDVIQVGCGESHIAVVTSENRVLVWGAGQHGQLGTGDEENRNRPVEVVVSSPGSKMPEVISNVRCGVDGTMMLTDTGRLFACGSNQDNKLGLNRRETFIMQMRKILNKERQLQVVSMSVPTPLKELGKHRVVDMSLGPTHTTVLTELGHVFTFGRNSEGQLCAGNTLPQNIPVPVRNYHTTCTPTMVTSSELCSIVTTDDNSFLVWGSRPVIKTSLGEILEQENQQASLTKTASSLHKCGSSESNVFSDGTNSGPGTPNRKRAPTILSQVSHSTAPQSTAPPPPCDPPLISPETNYPSSGEGSPKKTLSSDNITSPLRQSSIANDFKSSPRLIGSRNPSFNFSDIPHTMVPCAECGQYLKTLSDALFEALDVSANRGGGKTHLLKRESSSGTQLGMSHRRGASISSSSVCTGGTGREGAIIMTPTSMDLVGKSGILSLLSVEGIAEAKLEGLSCYGSNVLVLIQAQVIEGGAREEEGGEGRKLVGVLKKLELPTFRIGRKLTHRAHRRKTSVTPSPFQPPPSLHNSLPPPLHPPLSPPTHPPPLTEITSSADNSMVDTWIRAELEEAAREKGKSQQINTNEVSETNKISPKRVTGSVEKLSRGEGHGGIEAWGKTPSIKSLSRTLSETGTKQVKPTVEAGKTGLASKAKATDRELEQNAEERKATQDASKPAENRGQVRSQQAFPRRLKQASSTTSIAVVDSKTERGKNNPLNVKRVSSSDDVSRAPRPRPRVSAPPAGRGVRGQVVPGKIPAGDSVGRRVSAEGEGKREGSREGGGGKDHRLSLQSDGIRLPCPRGGKVPPTIQHEGTTGGGGGGGGRQSHHTTGKQHPSLEASPYAEPVPRIIRPGSKHFAPTKSRSPSSAKQSPSSHGNLEEKEKKAQQKELEEKSEGQLRESQEREDEMQAHIQQLQTQLQQQQSQIESHQNAMKDLHQKLQELQERPLSAAEQYTPSTAAASSSPRQARRRRIGIRGTRVRPEESETTSVGERQTKSRFCVVM